MSSPSTQSTAAASSSSSCPPRRVAIVTGGTRGIGRGISEAIAASGEFGGFLLAYNTNRDAAEAFASELRLNRSRSRRGGDVGDGGDAASSPRAEGGAGGGRPIPPGDARRDLPPVRRMLRRRRIRARSGGAQRRAVHRHHVRQRRGPVCVSRVSAVRGRVPPRRRGKRVAGSDRHEVLPAPVRGGVRRSLRKRGWSACGGRSCGGAGGGRPPFRGSLIGISGRGCNFTQSVSTTCDMPGSGKCVMEYAMRIFAIRAAPLGVNCNVIVPGVTRTEAWSRVEERRGMEPGRLRKMVVGAVPMGEDIDPGEIGDVAAFLCGSGGGRFVTGVSLPVDGGMHLGKPPTPPRPASK